MVFIEARSGYANLGLYPREMVVGIGYRDVGPWNFHESLEARFPDIFNIAGRSDCNYDISVGLNIFLNNPYS